MLELTKSQALLEESGKLIPGGVTSNVRLRELPFPLFFVRGRGSQLWDADGNQYIDYILANGPLILGHSPQPVLDRVNQAVAELQLCAAQTVLEIEVAQAIIEHIPAVEMVRFSLSGSEAVHAAIRLARGYTGRPKVIKFEGHYHGWFDNVLTGLNVGSAPAGSDDQTTAKIEGAGQDPKALEDVIVLPWNDLDAVETAFTRHRGQIAAVITEPICCNSGSIMPELEYLPGLRRLCDQENALLIFDEIITGFRVGISGAQGLFDITPDLSVFGKAIAGGFPLSVLAGKRDIMALIGNREVIHAGTFNGHVATLAAAAATIEQLSRDDGAAFEQIERTGRTLMSEIPKLYERHSVPCLVQGVPSMFFSLVTEQERITNAREVASCDTILQQKIALELIHRGVRVVPNGSMMISTAHTTEDVDETLSRMDDALRGLKR